MFSYTTVHRTCSRTQWSAPFLDLVLTVIHGGIYACWGLKAELIHKSVLLFLSPSPASPRPPWTGQSGVLVEASVLRSRRDPGKRCRSPAAAYRSTSALPFARWHLFFFFLNRGARSHILSLSLSSLLLLLLPCLLSSFSFLNSSFFSPSSPFLSHRYVPGCS